MSRQGAIQRIKLIAAGGRDGDGNAQIVAARAGAQFNAGWIKRGVKLVGNMGDCLHQPVGFCSHNFDRKAARVLDGRLVGFGGIWWR